MTLETETCIIKSNGFEHQNKSKKYYNGILSKGKYSWLDVKQQIASQWFTHWSIIPKVYY